MRQVVIEHTRLLSAVFLCSEFKLENIYSGVNFCGSLEKSQKLEPAKISCDTVTNLVSATPRNTQNW